jgi:hypothetical protein
MVTVHSFNKKPGAVLARRSGPFASPRSGSNSNCDVTYGELEAGAEAGAEAAAAASAAELAAEEAALASAAAEDAEAAAESAAAGAVVSCLAQAASASAATRALRTSFVFIELYPEKEKANGERPNLKLTS